MKERKAVGRMTETQKARNVNTKNKQMEREARRREGRGLCTDADGGSGDLSNGRLAEKQCSDLHGTSCYQ